MQRKLNKNQLYAVSELANGATIAKVARDLGITTRAIQYWLSENPVFIRAVNKQTEAILLSKHLLLIKEFQPSVDKLVELRDDETVKPSIQASASKTLIDIVNENRQQLKNHRISEIEAILDGQGDEG